MRREPQVGLALRLERFLDIADELLPMKRFDAPEHFTLEEFAELVQSAIGRQDRIEARLERLEAKLDRLKTQITAMDRRQNTHEGLTGSLIEQVIGWEDRLSQHLDRLEHTVRLQDAS